MQALRNIDAVLKYFDDQNQIKIGILDDLSKENPFKGFSKKPFESSSDGPSDLSKLSLKGSSENSSDGLSDEFSLKGDPLKDLLVYDATCISEYYKCDICSIWEVYVHEEQNKNNGQVMKIYTMPSTQTYIKFNEEKCKLLRQIGSNYPLLKTCGYTDSKQCITGNSFSIWYLFLLVLKYSINKTIYNSHFDKFYYGYVCGNKGKVIYTSQGMPLKQRIPNNTLSFFKQLTLICKELSTLDVIIPVIDDKIMYIKDMDICYKYRNILIDDKEALIINTSTFIPSFTYNGIRISVSQNIGNLDYIDTKIIYSNDKPYQVYTIKKIEDFMRERHNGAPIFPSFNYYAFIVLLLSIDVIRKEADNITPLRKLFTSIWSQQSYEIVISRINNSKPSSFLDICKVLRGIEMYCSAVDNGCEIFRERDD